MEAKTNLKSRLPSRHATEGPDRAPHRAFYYAMGLTPEQIHQPFVGVATCWNEAAPCNIALMRQAHQSFNYNYLGVPGYQAIASMVGRTDCYTLAYTDLDDVIGRLASASVR